MGTLEGRIAVVTGGTEGVGRGIAAELSVNGARVFVTAAQYAKERSTARTSASLQPTARPLYGIFICRYVRNRLFHTGRRNSWGGQD